MARGKSNETKNAKLTPQQKRAAIPRLQKRVEELKALDPTILTGRHDPVFEAVESKVNHTLMELFGSDTQEYFQYVVMLDTASINMAGETPLARVIGGYQVGIDSAVAKLESLIDLFSEEAGDDSAGAAPQNARAPVGRKIFVVHGHDDAAKLELARFLEKVKLRPVILHEEADRGQTIIEKFERHASEASFAVVILSPDDIGYPAGREADARPRARQNVILELGFFAGSLRRKHLVALHKGNVEIPSDLHGVLYVPMDSEGAWKFKLAKEIKAAGIDIDLNLAA